MTVPDEHQRPVDMQVCEGFYDFESYVPFHRWASFWYQLKAVLSYRPANVLEIGVGTGIVSSILRQAGVNVTTFDYDEALRPDIVGDIRRLPDYVIANSYDLVCAFQILEHLPFADFPTALRALKHASKSHILISLPYWGYPIELRGRIWKNKFSFAFARKLSRPHEWKFDGQHYWEMGTRGHSIGTVQDIISAEFEIVKSYFCPDYSYHYFFECRV